MTTIYVLKCEGGRFYIGKTNNSLDDRIQQHLESGGTSFTKKYPPTGIQEEIKHCDEFAEDAVTKRYMFRYGIDKVRGGSYASLILPDYQVMALRKEWCTVTNRCFKCLKPGHFVGQCPESPTDVHNYTEVWSCDKCSMKFSTEHDCISHRDECRPGIISQLTSFVSSAVEVLRDETVCARCGRNTHNASKCYARTHVNGTKL